MRTIISALTALGLAWAPVVVWGDDDRPCEFTADSIAEMTRARVEAGVRFTNPTAQIEFDDLPARQINTCLFVVPVHMTVINGPLRSKDISYWIVGFHGGKFIIDVYPKR